jgi:hypothetical protein
MTLSPSPSPRIAQLYLLRNMSSLGKPMIIVLVEGRPRILPPVVVESANAIVHAYLPGPRTFTRDTPLTPPLCSHIVCNSQRAVKP